MLTASAAEQHGHEFSTPRPSPSPTPKSPFFNGVPYSLFNSVMCRPSPGPSPMDTPAAEAGPVAANAKPTNGGNEAVTVGDQGTLVSPALSRRTSIDSNSTETKPRKRPPRPKTIYRLAQPPPITLPRQKLHIRPKILLQLQQVVPNRHPKPVYEVIPSDILAPRSVRRFARSVANNKLGPNDLMVVRAEEYSLENRHRSDEERWGSRDVVGLVCVERKDEKANVVRTEIVMDDCSCWEVSLMPNGGYEFMYTDPHGLPIKCRWVPKPAHPSRRTSGMSTDSAFTNSPADEKKFTFSTIAPTSRRHPIIATMTRGSIEVLDSYTMPSGNSPSTPSSPTSSLQTPLATPAGISEAGSYFRDSEQANDSRAIKTEEALRTFIVVTGIWVASCEGWYDTHHKPCPVVRTSNLSRPAVPGRAVSMSHLDSPRSASPTSVDEPRHTLPKLLRSSTQLFRLNSNFSSHTLVGPGSANTSPVSSPLRTRGRRSNSTGDADLNSKSGSMRRRFGSVRQTPTLPETDEERQIKRSVELMRIKELTIPSPDLQPSVFPVQPVQIIEPPDDSSRSTSPGIQNPRRLKTQSAYNPITTAGLWDSGVTDGPRSKTRPTSMVVLNGKHAKAQKKKDRHDGETRSRGDRFKRMFGFLRKEKH